MSTRDAGAAAPRDPIWLREQTRETRRSRALSRERILAAAVGIADREGMAGVSIRRVAAELEARPMSLYAHFETKDDLVAFMHDSVVQESLLDGAVPEAWPDALRTIARRTREVALRHPWLVSSIGHRPQLSPAIVRHAEESLAAVRNLTAPDPVRHAVVRAVDTFVLGHLVAELTGELGVEFPDDADGRARRDAAARYVRSHAAGESSTGGTDIDITVLLEAGDRAAEFEQGLDWLLAGIATRVGTS